MASVQNETVSTGDGSLMLELRKYLMLMAILAATVTYVAALNPPGGVWLGSEDEILTGDQILVVTDHARYNAFYYSNAIAFAASVVVILLLQLLVERSTKWLRALSAVMLLDLLALMVAYTAGASRGRATTAFSSVLVSGVFIFWVFPFIKDHLSALSNLSAGAGGGRSPRQDLSRPATGEELEFERRRKLLILFSIFAATVTYTAGMSPPGGFWPDSQDGHRAGNPVLQEDHRPLRRFMAFFFFNTVAFIASLVGIMILTTAGRKGTSMCGLPLVALICLLVAYAIGSSRKTHSTLYVSCLLPAALVVTAIKLVVQKHCTKKPEQKPPPPPPESNQFHIKRANSLVLLLATLAATITYQAGMNLPGGFWPDDRDGHKGSDPILATTHSSRYMLFFYCNSVALVASVVIMGMVLTRYVWQAIHKRHALEAAMILDLLSLVGAYAVGCCRDLGSSLRVVALAAGVLVYILIHMVFFTLEHKEQTNEEEDKEEKHMKKKRKLLLLLAILAATITYQAGLTPPGGFWAEDGDAAGNAVLSANYPLRYAAFFYCNATSFLTSIAIIILLVNRQLSKLAIRSKALYVCAVADLLGLMGAYASGSSRHLRTSIVLIVLAALVCASIVTTVLLAAFKPRGGRDEEIQQDTLQDDPEKRRRLREKYTKFKYLMLVGILVAGVTYQAGLTPPGGVWPDSVNGHAAGNPVLHDGNKLLYHLFFYSNSISFLASVVVILVLLLDKPLLEEGPLGLLHDRPDVLPRVAQCTILAALLGLLFAYASGCSREWETTGYVVALIAGVGLYFAVHFLVVWLDNPKEAKLRHADNKSGDSHSRCRSKYQPADPSIC